MGLRSKAARPSSNASRGTISSLSSFRVRPQATTSVLFVALLASAGVTGTNRALADDQPTPQTLLQIECSRQAYEKGLHGQARFDFRKDCLQEG
jgi:hypothetical protein